MAPSCRMTRSVEVELSCFMTRSYDMMPSGGSGSFGNRGALKSHASLGCLGTLMADGSLHRDGALPLHGSLLLHGTLLFHGSLFGIWRSPSPMTRSRRTGTSPEVWLVRITWCSSCPVTRFRDAGALLVTWLALVLLAPSARTARSQRMVPFTPHGSLSWRRCYSFHSARSSATLPSCRMTFRRPHIGQLGTSIRWACPPS
jgi:hypothetical protein